LPYCGNLKSLARINVRNGVLDQVFSGLARPWAMEFLSAEQLLVSEQAGVLKRINLTDGTATVIQGMPKIPANNKQIGLMDIVLHPQFDHNSLVYFSYVAANPSGDGSYTTAVARGKLVDDELIDVQQIFVAKPYLAMPVQFGGALEFDASGHLLVATGDRAEKFPAQDLQSFNGKILRLHDDGSIPAHNPFVGRAGANPEIFAYGLRNPQGLVYDPVSDTLYEAEHGPMGGDEVNVIKAGLNYGWPTIGYGSHYNTSQMSVSTAMERMEQPLFFYLPSIATSPIEIYRGGMFPEWEGNLLVGALKGAHVNKLYLVDGKVKSEQRILQEMKGRVRDIKVASDGSIYFLIQNQGRVFRLYRDTTNTELDQPIERSGEAIYMTICASCHSADLPGTPHLSDTRDWSARLGNGINSLYESALQGYNGMPARGMCTNCSETEIKAAVDYMIDQSNAVK
jgi:aldose sugar dehydrogenase